MGIISVVGSAIEHIVSIVLPKRERIIHVEKLNPEDIPMSPATFEMSGMQITPLMDYTYPAVEDLIRALKYDGSPAAAELCANVLAEYLREEIASRRMFSTKEILLVPVPLHRARKRERGFNQIELIVKRLPAEFRDGSLSSVAPDLLVRTRATKQQTHLPRAERLANVSGAFSLSDDTVIENSHVFIIDDVATTGATLVSAAGALAAAGADVTALALARA